MWWFVVKLRDDEQQATGGSRSLAARMRSRRLTTATGKAAWWATVYRPLQGTLWGKRLCAIAVERSSLQ